MEYINKVNWKRTNRKYYRVFIHYTDNYGYKRRVTCNYNVSPNIKKTSKYQSEHKNYEFVNDNEKLYFEIIKGELRCKSNNKKMEKFPLNEITPQKVEEDKEHSCYILEIKKGKSVAFRILNQDKTNLENFYFDLIEAKKIFGY